MDKDEYLTAREAADYECVSIRTVYQRRYNGTGPVSHRRNGRILFRRSDIDAYHERERLLTSRGGTA